MSFQNLKVDELQKVAEFFVVDVEAADEEKGATKKELLAALAAGDEPVTWDQYKDIYLKAVDEEKGTTKEVDSQEEVAKTAEENTSEPVLEEENPGWEEEQTLIKYERKNPTYEVVGYVFTNKHPFKSVPTGVADYLIRNVEGFRPAMPSEVTDYYS